MEIRHLRCFLMVAEELHFGRAAERLHMEQSPLSRAVKELEEQLKVKLFVRTTRHTQLTAAGKRLQEHANRVLNAVKQTEESMKSWSRNFGGQLRIALSDYMTPSRLPALLALCREHEPDTEIRLFEVTLTQQIKGLQSDLYDVGFALSGEPVAGVVVQKIWTDPLMAIIPARHSLLIHKQVPLNELMNQPLVLPDLEACKGYASQVDSIFKRMGKEPMIANRVMTSDLMLALVSAGLGVGLADAPKVATSREHGVVIRSLAFRQAVLTTYLLRLDTEPSPMLARFIELLASVETSSAHRLSSGPSSDTQKEIES